MAILRAFPPRGYPRGFQMAFLRLDFQTGFQKVILKAEIHLDVDVEDASDHCCLFPMGSSEEGGESGEPT